MKRGLIVMKKLNEIFPNQSCETYKTYSEAIAAKKWLKKKTFTKIITNGIINLKECHQFWSSLLEFYHFGSLNDLSIIQKWCGTLLSKTCTSWQSIPISQSEDCVKQWRPITCLMSQKSPDCLIALNNNTNIESDASMSLAFLNDFLNSFMTFLNRIYRFTHRKK